MPQNLSEPLLSRLSEFVSGQMGLYFPRERWRDLERGMRSATRKFGATDPETCAHWLLSAPLSKTQIEILAGELTVGETYFFRESRSFEILRDQILPEMIRARQGTEQRLRIWSAGCCTGEEAYSIAILLDRILPAPRQWNVTILATDINPAFLQKASKGIYSEWSFRTPPPWLKGNYFTPAGAHRYQILPRIKEKVTFAYLNLAEEAYPSFFNNTNTMDIIFCRNVLMYFDQEHVRKVIRNFHRSLVEDGWLIVSPTETSPHIFTPFAPVRFDGAVFYKKGDAPAPAMPFPKMATTGTFDAGTNTPPLPAGESRSFPKPLPPAEVAPPLNKELPEAAAESDIYEEAQALFEEGNYAQAALKIKTDAGFETKTKSLAMLARICADLGQLTEALKWAEAAISTDKLNEGAHYLRAIILQEQGATEDSIASLKRALYLDPDLVIAHFALGNLELQQAGFKESAKHFATALMLLERYGADDVLPHSDGLAAGRLKEMAQSAMPVNTNA